MCSWGWLGPVATGRNLPPGSDLRELRDWLLGQDAAGGGNTTGWHPLGRPAPPGAFRILVVRLGARLSGTWRPWAADGCPQPHSIHWFPVPQAQLPSWDHLSRDQACGRVLLQGFVRVLFSSDFLLPLCTPPAPAQAAGQLEGLESAGAHS